MKSFKDYLFEQEKSGKDFEDLVGGLLKGVNLIRSVEKEDDVLVIDPLEELGKIDVSLIMGAVQDKETEIKKKYNNPKSVRLGKMTVEL